MTALLAPVVREGAPLARLNPLARVGAALLPVVVLVFTVDPVTPALILLATVLAMPFTGVRLGPFLRRTILFVPAGLALGVTNVLFAAGQGGAVLLDAGPLHVTTGSVRVAVGVVVRVYAIALPGALAFATLDVTTLADALVQQLRLPWRFTLGALAAFRLLPLLLQEWQLIGLARRARGIDAGRNPVAALRLFWSGVFTLLVGAIRRGVRLATALEARGFGSREERTYARRVRMHARDWLLLAAAAAVTAGAAAVSVAAGTWYPALG